MSAPTGPIGNYPPLVKYQPYRRQGVQASGMAGLRGMQNQQDAIQRQKEDRATQQLLQFAQDPDVDLHAVAGSIDGLTMKGFELGAETQRVVGERRAREDELKNAVSTIQQAIPLGAGRLDEYGEIVQDPQAAALSKAGEERGLQALERHRPEQVADVQSLIALQREAARQNLLGQSAGIQREYTRADEVAMRDASGTMMAGQAMGVIPQSDIKEQVREFAGPDRTPQLNIAASTLCSN